MIASERWGVVSGFARVFFFRDDLSPLATTSYKSAQISLKRHVANLSIFTRLFHDTTSCYETVI
jgi:hypothetical protein